ncbi:hypothetical protein FB45DRAFT_1001310 [Roridomyces roridus]|uniref:Uncharacterized protein n=1 Tax=Roridomyces roridus TaxID=1738132 RepID=A0AAD7FRW7_9AGAR|nr:hypothetical protein FB45DRAFT_1001310 [Roridomyces roridus]
MRSGETPDEGEGGLYITHRVAQIIHPGVYFKLGFALMMFLAGPGDVVCLRQLCTLVLLGGRHPFVT